MIAAVVAVAVQLVPAATRAQDSLRVLRVQPVSPASPIAPVVITFDHPVAPRLGASLDAAQVLRIAPAVGARVYWRDPSTVVAEFDSAWAAGASYEVRIDPMLRSADGLALAQRLQHVVSVRMPRMLGIFASMTDADVDTIFHPVAVFDGAFDLARLQGRVWFVPQTDCRTTDSVALKAVRVRRVSDSLDSWAVREAGGYDRDRRLEFLRRVVEFADVGPLKRGCRGELRLQKVVGDSAIHRERLVVHAPFRFAGVTCPDGDQGTSSHSFASAARPAGRECNRGPVTIDFTNPVTADEVRARVLVNGQPARVINETTWPSYALLDSIKPLRTTRITVKGALRNTRGEQLGRDTTIEITGRPLPPSVGYAIERVLAPRDGQFFLRVRHVNTDSVIVIISRVADSLRSSVLTKSQRSYDGNGLRWEKLARDTVVHAIATRGAANSERVFDIPTSWIPVAWRNDPLLLVRATPAIRAPRPDGEKQAMNEPIVDRPRRVRAHALPAVDVLALPDEGSPRFAIVQRSNIAIHTMGTPGTAEVWVTSLRGAVPRAGVTLRVLDDSMRTFATGITNALGRATLRFTASRSARTVLHIEAAAGNDRALLALADTRERDVVVDEDSLQVHQWYGTTSRIDDRWVHGTAFAERGIYRPGERVYLGGAVRTFSPDSGYRTPSADSARWSIWNGGERLWSRVGRLSDFGTLADSFPLSGTARLGQYAATLALRAGGAWRTAARTNFRVAEYRAPEFAVHVDGDTTTLLFAGDTARLRVSARYLFGLPMDGGAVHWWFDERERAQAQLRLPGLEGYTVGRSDWRRSMETNSDADRSSQGDAMLAADGSFSLAVPTLPIALPGEVNVNVTVSDANRQSVTSGLTLPLHAANAYVGMRTRTRRWVWQAHDSVAVELLVVRADGTPRVGDEITVVAQRSRWIVNRWVRDTVWRTTLTSAASPVTATFR
ncbi:MAG: MG2 domain-containing protein, partial [Gemmatimonadota bacterium]|nr:MG2 domain-containing protein [Gemmatimonadota bacterium]